MKRCMYNLTILGISEMRWRSSEKIISYDTAVIFSEGEKHERGVAFSHSRGVPKLKVISHDIGHATFVFEFYNMYF